MIARLARTQSSDFDRVYHAAKQLNEDELSTIVNEGICIDVLDNMGLFTPAGKIAAEGNLTPEEKQHPTTKNIDALNLLIKFGAHPDYIGMGAAFAGELTYAEYCRNELGASPNMLAKGAAMAPVQENRRITHYAYAHWLQKNHGAEKHWIVFGMAYNGDVATADSIANNTKEKVVLLSGAALGKQLKFVKDFCIAHIETPEAMMYVTFAAAYAVLAGEMDFVDELVTKYRNKIHFATLTRFATIAGCKRLYEQLRCDSLENLESHIEGLAFAGKFNDFKVFPDNEFLSEKLFCALFRIQHKEERQLRHELPSATQTTCNVKTVRSLVLQGRLSTAVEIYNQHTLTYESILINILISMSESDSFANEKLTLHKLSFIDDHKFLKMLAWYVSKYKTEGKILAFNDSNEPITIHALFLHRQHLLNMEKLINDAIKINRLMKQYYFDFDQAQAFLKNKLFRNLLILLPSALNVNTFTMKPDTLYIIIAVLGNLNFQSAKGIYQKFSLAKIKILFINDMTKYAYQPLSRWGSMLSGVYHAERAVSLIADVRMQRTKEAYKSVVRYQHDIFSGVIRPVADPNKPKHLQPPRNNNSAKDQYHELILKHFKKV